MDKSLERNIFLDKECEVRIKVGGNLPHWSQIGKAHFVTFRLADSLPVERANELKNVREEFKRLNPEPWNDDTKQRYRSQISRWEEDVLNNGYGECILGNSYIREILSSAIRFGDGARYDLLAYVIMPNHVHILMIPYENSPLSEILHSIKSFSANRINAYRNVQGRVWMRESYDHIVRNEDELKHYMRYIKHNAQHLKDSEFELYH